MESQYRQWLGKVDAGGGGCSAGKSRGLWASPDMPRALGIPSHVFYVASMSVVDPLEKEAVLLLLCFTLTEAKFDKWLGWSHWVPKPVTGFPNLGTTDHSLLWGCNVHHRTVCHMSGLYHLEGCQDHPIAMAMKDLQTNLLRGQSCLWLRTLRSPTLAT